MPWMADRSAGFPALMLSAGRNVRRPAFFAFSRSMAFFADASLSQMMFCTLPPSAVSTATSQPLGTDSSSPTVPTMPDTPSCIIKRTAPLYPS